MHRHIYALLTGLLVFVAISDAQDSVWLRLRDPAEQDSVKQAVSSQERVPCTKPTTKTFILPATLIGYGIATLADEELRDWNEGLKEELWTEHPHRHLAVDNYLQWTPAAGVYMLDLAGVKGRHDLTGQTIIYSLSTLMMGTGVLATKHLFREERPDGTNRLSFPSGHTATAFAAAEFLRREYGYRSPWYGIAGYAMAFGTGFLRIYNNRHWMSDVLAGAGIGILSTDLAYILYPLVRNIRPGNKKFSGKGAVLPFYYQHAAGLSFVTRF
jgi:hypothetical protein